MSHNKNNLTYLLIVCRSPAYEIYTKQQAVCRSPAYEVHTPSDRL